MPNFKILVSIFWLDWIQREDLIRKLIIKIKSKISIFYYYLLSSGILVKFLLR
jgi:hypothetical protein